MGNVLCHHQNRGMSNLDEETLSSDIEAESSDERSGPCIAVVPEDARYKQKYKLGPGPISISQFTSGDIANCVTSSLDYGSTSSNWTIGNIFGSRWTARSSNSSRSDSTPGRNMFRDTQTYTQHEKWLSPISPTLIIPTLFLGSKKDSLNIERIKELKVTHILSVMGGKQHLVSDCKHLSVPMADSGNTSLIEVMNKSFDFIRESQQDGNKILIHCHRGQNRSATVVIAWLMTKSLMNKNQMCMYVAYRFVKERRDVIHPCNLYIQQLREYDKQLFGVYSVKPNFLSLSYEDGELKVKDENWSPVQSREYKELQKKESSQRFKCTLPYKIVNTTQSSDLTPLKKKGTYGSSSTSVLLEMTPVQDESLINIIYPAPVESFVSESSNDN